MSAISLTDSDLERALPLVAPGLAAYRGIQAAFGEADVANDRAFQRSFNAFYRVRRGPEWQRAFYAILSKQKSQKTEFGSVLHELHRATGRIEASFASKLVATVDPGSPVIDSLVLGNVGLRLRPTGPPSARIDHAIEVHAQLAALFLEYLSTAAGRRVLQRFEQEYPGSELTPVKMLDLVLWQSRGE